MTDKVFTALFDEHTNGKGTALTRRQVIIITHESGMCLRPCVRRMECMGLAKQGTWAWFRQNGGFSPKHIADALGLA